MKRRHYEILSDEEFKEEYYKYKYGNKKSENKIIVSFTPLILYIIKEYHFKMDMSEMVEAGYSGVRKALLKFDYNKNDNFVSYVYPTIFNELRMMYRKEMRLKEKGSNVLSLDADLTDNGFSLLDVISSTGNCEDSCLKLELYNGIRKIINTFPEREKKIVVLAFGFNGTPLSQAEIGEKLNYSQAYICRLLKKCLIRIKEYLINNNLVENKNPRVISKELIEEIANRYLYDDINFDRLQNIYNINKTSFGAMFRRYLDKDTNNKIKQKIKSR